MLIYIFVAFKDFSFNYNNVKNFKNNIYDIYDIRTILNYNYN